MGVLHLYTFLYTASLLWIFANGLKCYNCHRKCVSDDPNGCELSKVYLSSIQYNNSRDGQECPSDIHKWNDPMYTETCNEKQRHCGKRILSIQIIHPNKPDESHHPVTAYPILDTKRVYHTVYGCMVPSLDCNRKSYDYNKTLTNSDGGTNVTIKGTLVEEADCRQCRQDLCNGEADSPQNDDNNNITSGGNINTFELNLAFFTVAILCNIIKTFR